MKPILILAISLFLSGHVSADSGDIQDPEPTVEERIGQIMAEMSAGKAGSADVNWLIQLRQRRINNHKWAIAFEEGQIGALRTYLESLESSE